MRLVVLFTMAAMVVSAPSCAHVEAPPGGPPDETPPSVFSTRPEADEVLDSYSGAVVFVFDERISERGLEDAVMVSPRTSPVEVRHGRDEVRVSLRRGWDAGQIYHVILRPVVNDLFGNRLTSPATLVFSTGPAIPQTYSSGRVIDRITGSAAVNIRVEAIRTADSLVYAAPTDTAGVYRFEKVPEGEYTIRAFEDVNVNRSLEIFEPQDSGMVSIVTGDTTELTLRILMPDSTPPVAASARVREEILVVEFDDFLAPEQVIGPTQITVTGPSGSMTVARAAVGSPPETTPDAAVEPGPPGQQPPAGAVPGVRPPAPAVDLTVEPAEPLPSRTVIVELSSASDLQAPGEYTVTLGGIRNVNGLVGGSEVQFTVEAPPPADIASAFPDGSVVATLVPAPRPVTRLLDGRGTRPTVRPLASR